MITVLIKMFKSKKFWIFFAKWLAPLFVIIIAFSINALAGTGLILTWVAYLFYTNRAATYALIANIKYTRNGIEEALKWLKKAYESGNAKPKHGILYGYLLLKSGRIDEAEEILNKVVASKVDPDSEMLVKSNLALALWKRGRLEEAICLLEEVHTNFKTTNIYGSLGYLLIIKGDLDKALQFNLEAFEYNSSNSIILDNLGQTYYLRGEIDKAQEIYDKLMSNNPTFPEAYYNYSLVLQKQGHMEKAFETLKKSLDFKLSYLSTVTREEIGTKIAEMENILSKNHID